MNILLYVLYANLKVYIYMKEKTKGLDLVVVCIAFEH